jgi:DNA-directed RNA polymerase alpha subunit
MTTLEAVKNANPQELLQIKNFGRKSLNEVQKYFFS